MSRSSRDEVARQLSLPAVSAYVEDAFSTQPDRWVTDYREADYPPPPPSEPDEPGPTAEEANRWLDELLNGE